MINLRILWLTILVLAPVANAAETKVSLAKNELSRSEMDACIAEAKADVAFYKARVESANMLLQKAHMGVKYRGLRLQRAKMLVPTTAISQEELEEREAEYGQEVLNIDLGNSLVAERVAELQASEARLIQASEGRCIHLPSHR